MPEDKIVITGLGVISSNGIGKDAFFEGVFSGTSGIKPVSLFDTSLLKVKTAGEIKDFSPQQFLGPKGLRTLDRSTKLVASAAKMALDDAGLNITEENSRQAGIAIGDTLGSISSISDFDREALTEGPRYVNPALFPNTVINSPASQVSIKFNIKGFNATLSTGFSASLDAINYAVDMLKFGKAKVVLAGGVEELCIQIFLGFYKCGFLAGSSGAAGEICCPFDKRRNGVILGEGAGILVLETLGSALKRQATIYAQVRGFGNGFDAFRINRYNPQAEGLKKSMRLALEESGISAQDIDYICSGANSSPDGDAMETAGIKDVFGQSARELKISSIKSMVGECFSAGGVLQAIAALAAIEKQMVPPTVNYQEKDPACDLNYVVNQASNCKIDNVLINAFGPSGCNSSLVISKFNNN
ncbi:MAG: beta-ketoacyl-[acyl-carrier-protein] synthase family protein [Candidatus Omnitrophica bacterium]|nr:beta-ketoacyl-[acyl-carrier-protein] synthase family protein [Candidatus Omnitrophota bacterium]MBL7210360.1 beta-ketoacyl-[acyl-carrier-protein] synthase family protein [Candidatus Omnitrophota bacterium]